MDNTVIESIGREICRCRKCRLWETAKNAVPGEGPGDSKAMLIGQGPGREEDTTGRPFIGRSGRYLNNILTGDGISREELFITSVLKHWTPGNRKPLNDEIEACLPYLMRQIDAINPRIIVLMGEYARRIPRNPGIVYIETYHPASSMRFRNTRRVFERDIRAFAALYQRL